MAVCLCLTFVTTACDSLIDDKVSGNTPETYLEVEVSGLKSLTRAVIEGDTLPDNSHFGIYLTKAGSRSLLDNGFNIETIYKGGVCGLSQNISLKSLGDVDVYAFYPYSSSGHPFEMEIDAVSQTDYLWGRSVDLNGFQSVVNESNPAASIRFEHIMALITLRIHRSADNKTIYSIPSIAFDGDGENQFRKAYIDVIDRKFLAKDYGQFEPIDASLSATALDDENDIITADFLVIPSKTRWSLRVDFSGEKQYFWDAMPEAEYESGKRYIYDCEINKSGMLVISNCEIQPWETTEMPELETY